MTRHFAFKLEVVALNIKLETAQSSPHYCLHNSLVSLVCSNIKKMCTNIHIMEHNV